MTMPFYKKILILIIILLFSYVLYRLYKKRTTLIKQEGYVFNKTIDQEINDIKNTDVSLDIRSINASYTQLPISQYLIKGSFNSAVTSNFVSLDMLQYVLTRGCRFIDFEVFYLDGKPMVSYSNDPNFSILETNNKLLLDNVLAYSIANGFNSPAPNKDDPLFIQLRIKSKDDNVYNQVAKCVNNALSARLYKGQVTKNTKLSDIMGKVVLVMDRTINYNYKSATSCLDPNNKTCYDLTKYINMESGSEFMRTSTATTILNKATTPPTINNNNLTTDVQFMQVVIPDTTSMLTKNSNAIKLIKDYGCQIILFSFYNKDDQLNTYEEIFNDNLYAIVPLSTALIYLQNDPRGIMNDVATTYDSILGFKMNNGNNGGISKSLDENKTAIIIGSVLGGLIVFLIIGAVASIQTQKTSK